MENLIVPTQQGQICKTLTRLEGERDGDVYIITSDPSGEPTMIEVVSLNDLQRNVADPSKVKRVLIPLNNLTVLGEDLEDYVSSWNKA